MMSELVLCQSEGDDELLSLMSAEERVKVRQLLKACRMIASSRKKGKLMRECAESLDMPYKTLERKYYEWERDDHSLISLVDKRYRIGKASLARTSQPCFVTWLAAMAGRSQRAKNAAARKARRIWKSRSEVIPGYEDWPGWPEYPSGWSVRNLTRLMPDNLSLTLMRDGVMAAADKLPMVLTTRANLQAGEYYVIDDHWIDGKVICRGQSVRPLQLGCIDIASGKFVHWGMMPRMKDMEEGKHKQLSERHMKLFVAALLMNVGYNPVTGTTLVVENGTAAIREPLEKRLLEIFDGKVKVRRSGIVGKEQVLLGGFKGQGKGNPKDKTHLESMWNYVNNEVAAEIDSHTGHDRKEPEYLAGMEKEERKLLKKEAKLMITDPVRASHIQRIIPTFAWFVKNVMPMVYYNINNRQEHHLEGWEEMGFVTLEVRAGENLPWTDLRIVEDDEYADMLLRKSEQNPSRLQRARNLSPAEAWDTLTGQQAPLVKATLWQVIDLISPDLSRETKVNGSYILVHNREISNETLYYSSEIILANGYKQLLPDGMRVRILENLFDVKHLLILDERNRCLGVALLEQRADINDDEAVRKAQGRKKAQTAKSMQKTRVYGAQREAEIQATRIHNYSVTHGGPLTLEDHIEVQTEVDERTPSRAQKIAATRRSNEMSNEEMESYLDCYPSSYVRVGDEDGAEENINLNDYM